MAEELGLALQMSDTSDSDIDVRGRAIRGDVSDHSGIDIDTDSDDEPERNPGVNVADLLVGALRPRVVGWPLANRQRRINTNDALVDHLLKVDAVQAPQIAAAMKVCSRDQFVPGGLRDHPDVFQDSPLHVSGFGFNISAPHMHATCLQALDLKPGNKVLDIGSGSGLLSAYAAVMVGKAGSVVGIDSSKRATQLAKHNMRRLTATNKTFVEKAAACTFSTHNVFMPAENFQGQYDRIVAGASCPQSKVDWLISLLKPSGGILVAPVIPSELRKITKQASGEITTRVISQVRFSNLDVPKELSILKALVEIDRSAALKAPEPISTFASDIASISGQSSSPMASSSLGSDQTAFGRSTSIETPSSASWPRRVTKLFTACSSASGSERSSLDDMSVEGESPKAPASLRLADLGQYDCVFIGNEWSLPAHKTVLRNRSELFRAQCASGMKDAEATQMHVPENFTKAAVAAFLEYCYTDKLTGCSSAEATANCLAVAVYYGTAHLAQLCEISLADELQEVDEGTVKLAASLLALSDELGLPYLQVRAVDFIANNFKDVASSAAYQSLSKQQTDMITRHACQRLQHFNQLLDKMQEEKANPFDLIG